MKKIKRFLKYTYHQIRLFMSYMIFLITGKNSQKAYESLLSVFCFDGGTTMSIYRSCIRFFRPAYEVEHVEGVFGRLTKEKLKLIRSEIETKGYFISDVLVPESLCTELEKVMEETLCYPVRASSDMPIMKPQHYDAGNLVSSMYGFRCKDLISNPSIQSNPLCLINL